MYSLRQNTAYVQITAFRGPPQSMKLRKRSYLVCFDPLQSYLSVMSTWLFVNHFWKLAESSIHCYRVPLQLVQNFHKNLSQEAPSTQGQEKHFNLCMEFLLDPNVLSADP